jgi:precorrin-6Y C5,15-methyltransferase (decarboxylating)
MMSQALSHNGLMDQAETPYGTGRWLAIVGIGEDGVEGLTPAARTLIETAGLVVGGERHLRLAASLIKGEARRWSSPVADTLPDILARRGQPVCVLASGDPFCFGIGSTLAATVPAVEMLVVPALSSLCLAAARLGWSQQDVPVLSLCGRPLESLRPALQAGERVFVLSADERTPASVAAFLDAHGFGESRMTVLEALGGPREVIRSTPARGFALTGIARLNLMALELVAGADARPLPQAAGLPDDWFEHDGQITKREIRALTLSSLQPHPGALLWDIGCGSGSISIEWLLSHPRTQAIALEKDPVRAARAARNAAALGVPRLEVKLGPAAQSLAALPAPDAVFVGGGLARDGGLIEAAWQALKPDGRLVANAVTIEAQQLLTEAWQKRGGQLLRVSVERAEPVGGLSGFRPAMPVLHLAITKPGEAR